MAAIDTMAIYEAYNTNYYEGLVKQPDTLERLNNSNPNSIYGVFRFYGNGCYSLFHLDRKNPKLTKEQFDPKHCGWRGVLYSKNNHLYGDHFTQVGQMTWQLGKQTSTFTFHGDTLIVFTNKQHKQLYIKRSIDKGLLDHKAEW